MAKQAPVKHIRLTPEEIGKVEAFIFLKIEPLLPAVYFLLAVNVEKEGAQWLLQIFIERPQDSIETGISLQDCEQVSRSLDSHWEAIEKALHKEMPALVDWSYYLEVSSPGLFRPLKTEREFQFYQGRPVRVEEIVPATVESPKTAKKSLALKKAPDVNVLYSGTLQGYQAASNTVTLMLDSSEATSVILDETHRVLLNPVIRLEDEDSPTVLL